MRSTLARIDPHLPRGRVDQVARPVPPDPVVVLSPRAHACLLAAGDRGGQVEHHVVPCDRTAEPIPNEQVHPHRSRVELTHNGRSLLAARKASDLVLGGDEPRHGSSTEHAGGPDDELLWDCSRSRPFLPPSAALAMSNVMTAMTLSSPSAVTARVAQTPAGRRPLTAGRTSRPAKQRTVHVRFMPGPCRSPRGPNRRMGCLWIRQYGSAIALGSNAVPGASGPPSVTVATCTRRPSPLV